MFTNNKFWDWVIKGLLVLIGGVIVTGATKGVDMYYDMIFLKEEQESIKTNVKEYDDAIDECSDQSDNVMTALKSLNETLKEVEVNQDSTIRQINHLSVETKKNKQILNIVVNDNKTIKKKVDEAIELGLISSGNQ